MMGKELTFIFNNKMKKKRWRKNFYITRGIWREKSDIEMQIYHKSLKRVTKDQLHITCKLSYFWFTRLK